MKFVVCDDRLYYVVFVCNDYMEQWDFENWGIRYWLKTPEFLKNVSLRTSVLLAGGLPTTGRETDF